MLKDSHALQRWEATSQAGCANPSGQAKRHRQSPGTTVDPGVFSRPRDQPARGLLGVPRRSRQTDRRNPQCRRRAATYRLVDRRGSAVVSIAALLGMILCAGRARAGENQTNLQLDVVINSVPARMIGSFVRFDNGRIGGTLEELESLGLRPVRPHRPDEIIALDDIPTLKYRYEERTQRIFIIVDETGRKPQVLDAGGSRGNLPRAQADPGAVLNYDLLTSTSNISTSRSIGLANTSLLLDARAFSPYGTAEQSAIIRSGPQQPALATRLNSSFQYSDQNRMISYVAGDTISGGLAWSRPVRIGGLQAQRDFALRPDLITAPLATIGGSAAVPSTVDVYVNNIRTFSQDVASGPFSVNNVPLISGAGTTQLVVRDSAGRETRTSAPFYANASLLAPGLSSAPSP
ncbi:fimbrial biogenesis outer membrane usher protein [Bradyrhizobium sp. NAS96.2]|uniref:fimbrial biogenesis outer membrane usher protein n=1 Tax=Bradyrhizobium sp. NAS96.2 TaxID=1680160 RepID=UPI00143D02DF|nr:fimbrial biogenesis outer membrane usher protein [Bradyrhizobium sp. NAS96.2]